MVITEWLVAAPLILANCVVLQALSATSRSARGSLPLLAWTLAYALLIPVASLWSPRKNSAPISPRIVPGYTNSPRSISELCNFLPRSEPVLVLPLMFYQTHLSCGTTPASPGLGYPTFIGGPKLEEIVLSKRYKTIVVFEHFKTSNEVWSSADGCHSGGGCERLLQELSNLGYGHVISLPSLQVSVYQLK
jgi:hypothetical protein